MIDDAVFGYSFRSVNYFSYLCATCFDFVCCYFNYSRLKSNNIIKIVVRISDVKRKRLDFQKKLFLSERLDPKRIMASLTHFYTIL